MRGIFERWRGVVARMRGRGKGGEVHACGEGGRMFVESLRGEGGRLLPVEMDAVRLGCGVEAMLDGFSLSC